jgi:hypothetical protein
MDWTIKGVSESNHNPQIVINGRPGTEPLTIGAQVGTPVNLDAAGTRDPDGNTLTYAWFFYPEAGTGIPDQPVSSSGPGPVAGAGAPGAGGIPSAPAGGPRKPIPRVTVQNADSSKATVVPNIAGVAHVILVVEDDGSPSLTSYRRVILEIRPGPPPPVPRP